MQLVALALCVGIAGGIKVAADVWLSERRRHNRKTYYNENYLRSDAWRRKRALVLKRDRHKCVQCGQKATQIHHAKYAPKNIGREPIEWLVSLCRPCHKKQH
jgi:5-methylcytosine-specific restriction endonuclease McrA